MYTYEKPDNLVTSFEETRKKHPRRPFIGRKDASGEYIWQSYEELGRQVDAIRAVLENLGIGPGDSVGVIANNRPEWFCAAMATYGRRGQFIPMYEMELEKLWNYIIKDSRIKVLFVATRKIRDTVAPLLITSETLEHIFVIDDHGDDTYAAVVEKGKSKKSEALTPSPHEIANIVYTSGTTGEPKGVMLTHGNITSNARAGWHFYPYLNADSTSISILPWAHSYGMTAELFCFMQFGGRIGIMGSVATLGQDIEILKPTIIIGVPRIFNRIYEGLQKKFAATSWFPRKIIYSGIESGKKCRRKRENGKTPIFCALNHKIINRLIFSKIRKKFGGNIRALLTASAAIKPEVIEFFMAIGLPLYEAYGMTETSPAISMNREDGFRIGSVGQPLEYIEVRIEKIDDESCDGEILARGPNVMKGYLNKPEATAEIITPDGWVRTGDRGYLDEDNFLYITGRIKEQYKLENGKYVFPAALEEAIAHNQYITNAFVYGNGENYNVALVVPDFQALITVVEKKNISLEPEDLCQNEGVISFLLKEIRRDLEGEYGHYEIPRKILLIPEPFSLENGILTQTLKTKRHVILERYGESIRSLYKEDE
ncbi:long-chain fatty acid--CoA ligase [Myxococcota bacterium]|nr:long-chain fatty acid--CoA ligase [Myxococcota bacterium]MBU1379676.1 long-chain fatty acid--CoA ligase [Myxococcota bacterium]MBU1498607.1 long-chain fatty acid--CoA ligase [Myxococcota bacterium]